MIKNNDVVIINDYKQRKRNNLTDNRELSVSWQGDYHNHCRVPTNIILTEF